MTRRQSRWGRPPNPRRAYTVIEVIMALSVLTLGTAGVIAMQKAALIGNTQARNLATANSLAQSWMERMRIDSLSWTDTGYPSLPSNLPNTKWLKLVGTGWFPPSAASAAVAPIGASAADIMGADVYGTDVGNVNPAFCAQAQLTRFTQNPVTCSTANIALGAGDSSLCTLYRMIRVEVRVYWDKSGNVVDCTQALPTDYTLNRYGFVYLVSAILENNAPL